MSIESDIFSRFVPDFKKLKTYGFVKKDDNFVIEKLFKNAEFRAIISINDENKIQGTVIDVENGEEYLPFRLEHQEGSFIGDVKSAYTDLLMDIRNNCFTENNFIGVQANRISDLIFQKFGDKPLFMWKEYPTFGVFKNPESNKWYGLIMSIERSKLCGKSSEPVEVMNLKLNPESIPELVKIKGIYPAYHMNKKYWISLTLDDTLADNEIMKYISESYSYTIKKKKVNSKN